MRVAQAAPPTSDHVAGELRKALGSLSEPEREIITLTAWEGLRPRQIARVLGMSPNAVRIRLHRARARLREQLEPEGPQEPPRDSDLSPLSVRSSHDARLAGGPNRPAHRSVSPYPLDHAQAPEG